MNAQNEEEERRLQEKRCRSSLKKALTPQEEELTPHEKQMREYTEAAEDDKVRLCAAVARTVVHAYHMTHANMRAR